MVSASDGESLMILTRWLTRRLWANTGWTRTEGLRNFEYPHFPVKRLTEGLLVASVAIYEYSAPLSLNQSSI